MLGFPPKSASSVMYASRGSSRMPCSASPNPPVSRLKPNQPTHIHTHTHTHVHIRAHTRGEGGRQTEREKERVRERERGGGGGGRRREGGREGGGEREFETHSLKRYRTGLVSFFRASMIHSTSSGFLFRSISSPSPPYRQGKQYTHTHKHKHTHKHAHKHTGMP